MKQVFRTDVSSISKTTITDQGFLKFEAPVTRSGIFLYRNADGSCRREYRPQEEVFKYDCLESMKLLPITNDHPAEKIVTPETAKKYQVGHTGEQPRRDGDIAILNGVITDAKTIADIKGGKNQLSLGYYVDTDETPGEINGQRFDAIQRNINNNHLAVCHIARAGSDFKIKLDSNDAIMIDNSDNYNPLKEIPMPKFNIDGIDYEAAQEVINLLQKTRKERDDHHDVAKKEKAGADTLQAKLDSANDELKKAKDRIDELEKRDIFAEAKKIAIARASLVKRASVVIDSAEEIEKLSDLDLKKAVIVKVFPASKEKIDSDKTSVEYIEARFDAAVEIAEGVKNTNAMAGQREKSAPFFVDPNATKTDSKTEIPSLNEAIRLEHAGRWKTKTE